MESIIKSFELFYNTKIMGYINTLIEYPIKILALTIDVTIVVYLIVKLIKMIKGTRAIQLIKGVAFLLIANVLSEFFSLNILHYILNTVVTYGVLLFIIVFQPELRNMLEQMGSTSFKNFFDKEDNSSVQSVSEVVTAAENLAKKKIGALIVFERESSLGEVIHTGVRLDSAVSKELLENIFIPDTPLHDGAVVIKNNKIAAASCILPITDREDLDREFGTRHRAAVGISEFSDAVVVVVSEETGKISLVTNGKIVRNLSTDVLKKELRKKVKMNNIKDMQFAQKMAQLTKRNQK